MPDTPARASLDAEVRSRAQGLLSELGLVRKGGIIETAHVLALKSALRSAMDLAVEAERELLREEVGSFKDGTRNLSGTAAEQREVDTIHKTLNVVLSLLSPAKEGGRDGSR